jgi:cytochrome c-type biogenesis protein CcmH/NrfG
MRYHVELSGCRGAAPGKPGEVREEERMSSGLYRTVTGLLLLAGLLSLTATPLLAEDEAQKTPVQIEREVRDKLKESPNDPELHYQLGNALYDQGRREEAAASYEKAIKIKPDYVKALVNLGVVLNESSKSEEALVSFDKAEELAPKDVTVLCNKGQALYALQRYPEGIALYQKAMGLEPENQLPYYLLGVAFADAGIYREAIREWEKVVALDPKSEAGETASESIKVLRELVPKR